MNPRARIVCSVAVGLFFVCEAAPAPGGEADAGNEAREHAQDLLDKGNALFRAGDFHQALTVYQEAHQTFGSPKLFFNIGLCEDSLGEGPLAMEHFATFVRDAEDASPVFRADAQARIAALRARLVLVDLVKIPPNAAVRIDGKPSGMTPLARPIWLLPGPHRFAVETAGHPLWVTAIEGKPGTTLTIEMPATIPAAPPAPRPAPGASSLDRTAERSTARRFWWLWTGIGVVLIGGATATYFALRCPATHCE